MIDFPPCDRSFCCVWHLRQEGGGACQRCRQLGPLLTSLLGAHPPNGGDSPPARGARAAQLPRLVRHWVSAHVDPRAAFPEVLPDPVGAQGGLRGLSVSPAGFCPETVSVTEAGGPQAEAGTTVSRNQNSWTGARSE